MNKALDFNNDEIIRVNQRLDSLTSKIKQPANADFDTFKNHVERKLLEMDQRHHNAFDDLDEENTKLRDQVTALK